MEAIPYHETMEETAIRKDIPVNDLAGRMSEEASDTAPVAAVAPLQQYLNELGKFKLLTRDEETRLAERYKEDNDREAAKKLVVSHLRLVVKIAVEYQRYWTKGILDLVQEGNLGLLRAVEKYDPYRGIKFSYYASFWIRAYIMKYILDNWRLVKIGTTQGQRKLFFSLAKERRELLAQGIVPEPKLLAERLNVRKDEVIEMDQRLKKSEFSIHNPVNDGAVKDYNEMIPAPGREPDEMLAERQKKELFSEKVKEFSGKLSDREADIFQERLMAEDPLTLQELGDRYHISRERVRQIQVNIIQRMKSWLNKEVPNFKRDFLWE